MQVTRSLATPPTVDERRQEGVAEVGRFELEDGCETDCRRALGRPTESALPSRPMRELERAAVGVAATLDTTGILVPVRCDTIAWFFLASDDGVAGDLVSVRARSLCACLGVNECGEGNWTLPAGLLLALRACPFLCSKTRRAALLGVDRSALLGLPCSTVWRTRFHLLACCRFCSASVCAEPLRRTPGADAADVCKVGSLLSVGRPQGLLRPCPHAACTPCTCAREV
jgi:hypothetical protein